MTVPENATGIESLLFANLGVNSIMYRNAVVIALCGLGVTASAEVLAQQSYPAKAIRMVIPLPPGGTSDILARIAAQKITEATGQPVIAENRGGAGGNIGTEIVAKAPPDGYTLLTAPGSTLTVNPSLYKKLPFDTVKDFAPITILAEVPNILIVHPSLPANNVRELIALAKARPGQLNYASTGTGQSTHLAMELFKTMAGVNIVHVPYKGGGQALPDLLGGQVSLMFGSVTSSLPHVRAGKLRALGVSTLKRLPALPELATIAESGLPGFEVTVWYGVLAPSGTPRDIVARINSILVAALRSADLKQRLSGQGAESVGNTPEEFETQIRSDLVKWAKVIRDSGAKLD